MPINLAINKGLCYKAPCNWMYGSGEPVVEPEFLTFALVNDPDLAGFVDWQFVGFDSFDFCSFLPAYSTNFGVDSLGCFDGSSTVLSYWSDWASSNGTPMPTQADQGRDQTALAAYIFIFWGQNTPPDMQITTALGAPVVPNWQVISPVCLTTTFTVDNIADGCYIEHFMYGYDDITTYEFGVFNTTDIASVGWSAYLETKMPVATPNSVTTSIVGNDVTVTVQNVFHFMRGMKWTNPNTLASGTTLFTLCP